MPEYLSPGVYVEERDTGPKPIEGVSTTTSGMVGITERGPLDVPTLVIGSADFRRQFGGLLDRRIYTPDAHGDNWYLPHAVDGFFTNGGKRLYIVRVLPDQATTAEAMLFDRGGPGLANAELAVAAQVGDTGLVGTDNTGIAAGDWLKLVDGNATEYVEVLSTNAAVMAVRGLFRFTHPVNRNVVVVTPTLGTADTLSANTSVGDKDVPTTGGFGPIPPNPALPPFPFRVEIGAGDNREYALITGITGTTLHLQDGLQLAHNNTDSIHIVTAMAAGASTTLTNVASPGDRLFVVGDGTIVGFTAGAVVQIAGTTSAEDEFFVIEAVAGAKFNAPAALLHAPLNQVNVVTAAVVTPRTLTAKANAGSHALTLSTVAGLTADSSFLQIDTGNKQEFAQVHAVDTTNRVVTLRDPLAFDHDASTTNAPDVTFTLVPNSASTLAARVSPGETLGLVQQLTGIAGYAASAIIKFVGTAVTQDEYRLLSAVPVLSAVETGVPAAGANPAVPVPLARMHLSEVAVLGRDELLTVDAIDLGRWAGTTLDSPNHVEVIVEDDDPILDTTAAGGNVGDPTLTMRSTVGVEPGTILEIGYIRNPNAPDTPGTLQKVSTVTGNKVGFAGGLAVTVTNGARVRSREFRLTAQLVQLNPANGKLRAMVSEGHRRLSMDPRHSRYVTKVIGPIFRTDATTPRGADGRTKGESGLIRVEDILADPLTGLITGPSLTTAQNSIRLGPDLNTATLPDGRVVPVPTWLLGGNDSIGNVSDDTYIGQDDVNPENRTGLNSLKNVPEISIVAIPGRTSQKVQQAVIDHCELLKYRFGVLDAGRGEGIAEVQEHRSLYDTKYAAIYHPWLVIDDPFPDNPQVGGEVWIPPAGHMMGIYARSDIERGVHKAPANEVISGILDLATFLHKEEQDILNPRNINVLRNFRDANRALRVWGARTLSSDPDWKYINVRRLFIFIEHSIDNGTQWVVFEPNSEPLWQRVIRVVSSFLRGVWRDGALMGTKPEEAYYVKCDRTTMTQNDIDNGRLIVEIGIAPVKPAEFVIFRIGQWSGGSSVEEG
jgi:uncharacterized protein